MDGVYCVLLLRVIIINPSCAVPKRLTLPKWFMFRLTNTPIPKLLLTVRFVLSLGMRPPSTGSRIWTWGGRTPQMRDVVGTPERRVVPKDHNCVLCESKCTASSGWGILSVLDGKIIVLCTLVTLPISTAVRRCDLLKPAGIAGYFRESLFHENFPVFAVLGLLFIK